MIAVELIIGGLGASLSLGSGLFSVVKTYVKRHHEHEKEAVAVTVQTGDTDPANPNLPKSHNQPQHPA